MISGPHSSLRHRLVVVHDVKVAIDDVFDPSIVWLRHWQKSFETKLQSSLKGWDDCLIEPHLCGPKTKHKA